MSIAHVSPFLMALVVLFVVAWMAYLSVHGAPQLEILPDVREARWDEDGHH